MMKWWQKTIAYELYPKSFLDTAGNGTGTIRGIIQKLDYLASLGVGAVWMTPVCRSPMIDNGYDIADYCSIDPSYGTMDDMKELISEAKKRGIRIVIDLVFNHSSDQNPWFLESKQSRDNPKSDWYIWRDAKDGKEPTNWRGIFGGSAWTWCEERQQYYLHTFAAQQPDLNWANPEVRRALYDAANFWVDLGAGGFRIDAITYVKKPDVFTDGEPDGDDGMVSVHDMTANQPGILDYLHEFKREVADGHDIFTVAEANGVSADELKYWVGKDGAFDMLFEFSHVNLEFKGIETWCRPDPWTISDLKRVLRDSQDATKDNGWYPIFFENHDKPRSIDHYFPSCSNPLSAAKALGCLLMTLRGTPFLFQGEELGYRNVAFPSIDDYNDISSHGQYDFALSEGFSEKEALACVHRFSRDSARTPMQWDASENAGFTAGTPWLPVHPDYKTVNVKALAEDPRSILNWYRKLAELRRDHPALTEGTWIEVLPDDPDIIAYRRVCDTEDLSILINLTEDRITDLPLGSCESILLNNKNDYERGCLRPLQCVILKM
ncbi:MAG: alpha-glucosidase [Solobacterium sp.]|nr:alpha-glucosidase [Solobacterium sp.]